MVKGVTQATEGHENKEKEQLAAHIDIVHHNSSMMGSRIFESEDYKESLFQSQQNNIYEEIVAQKDRIQAEQEILGEKHLGPVKEQSDDEAADEARELRTQQFAANCSQKDDKSIRDSSTLDFGFDDKIANHDQISDSRDHSSRRSMVRKETYVGADPILYESGLD